MAPCFCEFAQWEPFEFTIARQSLLWLGHVARMGCERLPKQALFGWCKGHNIRQHPHMRQQQWLQYLLAQIQVTELDWFRVAQDREEWKRVVLATFPITKIDKRQEALLNAWEPGLGPPPQGDGRFRRENASGTVSWLKMRRQISLTALCAGRALLKATV